MTDFVCDVDAHYHSACEGLDFYGEHEGKRYCVLHFPSEDKGEVFQKALEGKLEQKDYDFRGAVFPEGTSDFRGFKFDADVRFVGATFLGKADFSGARFNGRWTNFAGAQFNGKVIVFAGVQFGAEVTDFQEAQFSGEWTDFSEAQFSSVVRTDFSEAKFSGEVTSFLKAQFHNEVASFSETWFSSETTDFSETRFNGTWTSFLGAQFSRGRTNFSRAQFSGGRTDFSRARFTSKVTDFKEVQFSSVLRTDFRDAQFSGRWIDFKEAQFSGEVTDFKEAQFDGEWIDFIDVQFGGEWTSFLGVQFSSENTDFSRAQFSGANTFFQEAVFTKKVAFSGATFVGSVNFWGTDRHPVFGPQAWAWFDRCRMDKPELLTFNTVLLRPSWFINVDVRKVDFTNVKWYGMPGGPEGTLDKEIGALKELNIESPHVLLSQACQRLSANAEENREYPLANEFHYWSLDALRQENWGRFGLIRTMYWALSGYGVRAAQAFWVLISIWAAFTALYVIVGPSEFEDFGQGIGYVWQAAVYSLLALARLNPEPRPDEPGMFQFLVGIEGILGPLQIALLALAVRRKVMR